MRAYVDLGANMGRVAADFAKRNPDFQIFCVEPNPDLIPYILAAAMGECRIFNIIWGAAWINDEPTELYFSGAHEASTIVKGKIEPHHWPQVKYDSGTKVPCFDFSAWLKRTFNHFDKVIVKMDIEGAEYDLLEKMIEDNSIEYITELRCEWHQDRYPHISRERHDNIRTQVGSMTNLVDWH